MSGLPGGSYWSTTDELNRLRILADDDPWRLLAAYNGTRMRDNWGMMDGEVIRAEASKLAKRVLLGNGSDLADRIPKDWPFAQRLAKSLRQGKNG